VRFNILDCCDKPFDGFVIKLEDVKSQALGRFWTNAWQSFEFRYQSGKRTCIRRQAVVCLAKSWEVEAWDVWHQLALLFVPHVFGGVDSTIYCRQDKFL